MDSLSAISDYMIVSAGSLPELQAKVKELMASQAGNWKPLGGVENASTTQAKVFCQALVKVA